MTTELWADVGGTFTDCILRDDSSDQRRTLKILSTGLLRGKVLSGDAKSPRIKFPRETLALGETNAQLPDDFFLGASLHRIDPSGLRQSLGEIVSYDTRDGRVALSQNAKQDWDGALQDQCVVEIDCHLEAPVLAAHVLLRIPVAQPLPALSVRLGTTRGTNALLTRRGAPTALVVTEGFGDLLEIGEQDRGELFDLHVRKSQPLLSMVIEARERLDAQGDILRRLDEEDLKRKLRSAHDAGIESLSICLMHSYLNDDHEKCVESIAREIGFQQLSRSSEVAPLIKLVSRSETTTLDAYLNPILSSYVSTLNRQFGPSCHLRLMTSGGNLVAPGAFRGRDSILSGPAGGVVALEHIARKYSRADDGGGGAIGLDMGGTSTDVSRFDGRVGRRYESRVAGVRVMTPMMDIHTVAAGGGSICDCVDGRLTVGPDSAGADPGPACYGRGGPLALTDVNVLLGRIAPSRFPFPLDARAAKTRLDQVLQRVAPSLTWQELAEGFLDIAVTHMAEAATAITTACGVDVRAMTLVGFGGAAAQHVCRVADALQITRILDSPDASVFSALGMGLAGIGRVATKGIYQRLDELDDNSIRSFADELAVQVDRQMRSEFSDEGSWNHHFECECRYVGTDSSLTVPLDPVGEIPDGKMMVQDVFDQFAREHQRVFGYQREERAVELVSMRCDATSEADTKAFSPLASSPHRPPDRTSPLRQRFWFRGSWLSAKVFERKELAPGTEIPPASMVVADQTTLIVEPNWSGRVLDDGTIELTPNSKVTAAEASSEETRSGGHRSHAESDPILLEVVARRLQGIADAMGEVLRRTAVSVNVKERLDYSCAVFRRDGALVANAAHVPVHLGAMGHTVRRMIAAFEKMSPGDCFVSNDPFTGGSHLPDVTLVTPVFCDQLAIDRSSPDFFVASRAHHAEIGGVTPGSMPPDARSLAEEGVLIRDFALSRGGFSFEPQLLELLSGGVYPSRNPEENLADIAAQRAAGLAGVEALKRLAREYGVETVDVLMDRLLSVAGDSVSRLIASLPERPLRFEDALDDGTRICVAIERVGEKLVIDFDGTADVHPGAFNATPSIVTAAVLYVLRCLCDSQLPLCDGVLRDVDLGIPVGLLNPPAHQDPSRCAAVVAGNVETSQRVVDVLLGAWGVADPERAVAASQGTMNNVLVGDESFGYYETIGGGAGASASGPGASAIHTHMTNTRITDPEILESRLPMRLNRFAIRRGSGGKGLHPGGDGMIREIEFLKPLSLTMISNRRMTCPYGVAGGGPGSSGKNQLRREGNTMELPPSFTMDVQPGDQLTILTPGGGGWGRSPDSSA